MQGDLIGRATVKILTFRLRPSDVDVALLVYSHGLMSRLEQLETGVDPGYIVNGGLFIASTKVINFSVQVNLIEIIHFTKERLNEYKRLHSLGKAFGTQSYVIPLCP